MNNNTIVGSSSMGNSSSGGSVDRPRDPLLQNMEDGAGGQPGDNLDDGASEHRQRPQEVIRSRMQRHLNSLARSFNILDRLFKRNEDLERYASSRGAHVGAHADGVFSNLAAKPDRSGSVENTDSDKPPTYDEAAADMVPPYYGVDEDGVGLLYNEICIDGLPVGNIVNCLWNLIISSSFQFIGFLMTYILHTSHAARHGSRFGLGFTFMQYGYSMLPRDVTSKVGKSNELNRYDVQNPNDFENPHQYLSSDTPQHNFKSQLSHGLIEQRSDAPALSILLIIFGLFILIKSVYDYTAVKRKERKFLSGAEPQPV
ncbi:HGL055Wp [Eremothecium sinecaudum]|uniref:HGL055Wp n=1 Tax=Eremothecium sinecaudum TaxID=45286 RepID=A0A0X8HVK7_9SACH|nr:HGL055Wp [Eremothecium sinecaudum]AMD22285.1 HGL055Wp [Eremothecium sinecaudum]